jgi:hypothetical protein
MGHHILNAVTPPTALRAIENDMGNCRFAFVRLIGSLKGYRPDQVVTILGTVVWNHLTEFGEG